MASPQSSTKVLIKSEPKLPGWNVSGRIERVVFNSKGYVLDADATRHTEFKPSKKKGGLKVAPKAPIYRNDLFTPWQNDMARHIHDGKNLIANAATSCGKTWVTNLVVAYEVLSKDNCTCLIVSPNSEVMRETVQDISEKHTKRYQHSTHMMDTTTRNFATYPESRGSGAQIMVVSVESFVDFVTNPVNQIFINKLKYIVFDEVHLPIVANSFWWAQYIPHEAQIIVLSATLGDPDSIKETVTRMQQLVPTRPHEVEVISYNVRPIPLQPLLFKGCDLPDDGLISKSLIKSGRIACLVNRFDPTIRDIRSLDRGLVIPETREAQYALGQQVVKDHSTTITRKLQDALETCVLEGTTENVYHACCCLFSNNMQPAMCYNSTSEATRVFTESLVSYITQIERTDPECREAQRTKDKFEKEHFRVRDKKDTCKADARARDDWNKPMPEEKGSSIDIHQINKVLQKWKFPSDLKDIPTNNVPQWILDALEKGIGVYVSTMPVWLKHYVFDAFKAGQISFMMADNSISVGVNLPIRTVLLIGEDIEHKSYLQASGRAGRRGMDDQGYIMHFMPSEQIFKYLETETPPVHLELPETMNYADLIRLCVPENLDRYYNDTEFLNTGMKPVSGYKTRIMTLYRSTLNAEQLALCEKQVALIHKDKLHYHTLTNLQKAVPEAASVLVLKLLISGLLHSFQVNEFIDLMAILFRRYELPENATVEEASEYYVPQFERFRGFNKTLQTYSDYYNLGLDLSKPIHSYFRDFCKEGTLHSEFIDPLDRMGEWLYCFKKQVDAVCPVKKTRRGRIFRYNDAFGDLLSKVDAQYMIARSRRSMSCVKKPFKKDRKRTLVY